MSKKAGPNSSGKAIFIRGARQHNLKNLDLEIPVGKITQKSELMSTMPAFEGVLTPTEAADLVAFLQLLQTPE